MYGFLLRPKWLAFHAIVLVGIIVMVNLGFWQLRRLDDRQQFNQTVVERTEQSPVEASAVLDGYDPDADEWTPVRLRGTYLPDQIVQFNVSQGGRAGENVLTALVLDEGDDSGGAAGTVVLVNRGFIPLGASVPPPPATVVEIAGVVRASQVRGSGGLTDAETAELTEVRRIDVPLIAATYGGEVAPFYVQLFSAEPPVAVGDPEPVARPELSNGPHLSYAMQWFIFAVCVAIGWVLAVRRSIKARRRADAAA